MFSSFADNELLSSTLQDYIERKLQSYRLPEYAYTVVNKKNPSKILIISSYPDEWIHLYKENNFQHIDPVVLTAFKRTSPFTWDENITLMTDIKVAKIFSLSKKYNIVNGYTFVLHDHLNNVALLSLIINQPEQNEVENTIASGIAELQLALIEIHEQMLKLTESKLTHSGSRQQNNGQGKPIFTPQEGVVLHWASMGKTYSEISAIMGITTRTVKFHMGNLVRKMGVNNARQAIRLGVELNLITPSYR